MYIYVYTHTYECIFVHIYIYTHVRVVCMLVRTLLCSLCTCMLSIPCIVPLRHATLCCTGLRNAFVVMYVFIYVRMYGHMFKHIFIHFCTCILACVSACIYIYIDAYVYVCLCVRRHAYGIIFLSMFCIYV